MVVRGLRGHGSNLKRTGDKIFKFPTVKEIRKSIQNSVSSTDKINVPSKQRVQINYKNEKNNLKMHNHVHVTFPQGHKGQFTLGEKLHRKIGTGRHI